MVNIRRSIFETNSSSMHSIGIQRRNTSLDIPETLVLKPGEFGWQHSVLSSPEELGSYLYTAVLCLYYDKKEISDWKNYIYDTCCSIGCNVEFVEPSVDKYGFENCHIDHCDDLNEWLKKLRHNEKRLVRFLFGQLSFVITSNDNDGHDYLQEMENNLMNNVEVYFKGN